MEKAIRTILPQKFGLILDGWSNDSEHYVALFAVFTSYSSGKNPKSIQRKVLLAFQPFLDEEKLDTQSHFDFFESTLELYFKSKDNLMFIVGDNVALNGSLAREMGVSNFGCTSHIE